MCCERDRDNSGCWNFTLCSAFLLFVGSLIGGFLLGLKAVPDLRHYLDEERHYVDTTCRFLYSELVEVRDCTYEKDCGEGCSITVHSTYNCIQVLVSYEYSNGSSIDAVLFRSYQDAVKTDFECSAYECANNGDILEYAEDIEKENNFKCCYHPDKLQITYFDTANPHLVKFALTCGILLIAVPFVCLVSGIFWICYPSCPKCRINISRKISTGHLQDASSAFQISGLNSPRNIVPFLKNGRITEIKKYLKKADVNKEIRTDGIMLAPLAIAARSGHVDIMKYLVSIGANLHYVNREKRKGIFHFACESGNEEAIRWCIEKELPINAPIFFNKTPFTRNSVNNWGAL